MEAHTNAGTEGESIVREPPTASEAVIEAVASAEGVTPTGLSVPLYDAIDPDALDQIFSDAGDTITRGVRRLAFPYAGYRVTVHGARVVSVDVADQDAPSSDE